ncbi:hypothetical protein [Flavobacterium cerinum]|uniref:Uncharacterized protein n=1 Tax=Flavobacterium cerinum TaxID=2502784 RepID=A0ABY5ITG4_9FLAO|nr:hypothetical protein [Flavobacterium cerinum]UUC45626.1 hypothetical protein NOX80_00060 [Flavobacterium cerinum]
MKNSIKNVPEIVLIGLAVFSFVETLIVRSEINYLMIIVMAIMIIQLVFKNRYFGVFLGLLVGLVSFGLLLAVISDYRKFPTVNSEAIQLLSVGGLFSLIGAVLSAMLLYKYFNQQETVKIEP